MLSSKAAARRASLLRRHWPTAMSDLKRARLAAGLSVEELAQLAGIGPATVARAEADPASATDKTMRALAAGLHLDRAFIDKTYRDEVRSSHGVDLLQEVD